MRDKLIYPLLLGVKVASCAFYRFDVSWIGRRPPDPWSNLRLVLFLNHTSLFEPLFAGWVPCRST